ncbi:hypothetical protein NC653_022653 [Populus alba x Populus x berolinensis]|uniref:Uncharacterized protein n=1 Tax=Populus alba x Populus x berolinensis TaxID=444605 RepID=A0AAD6MF93_9ROSI|nr:hypothetical protein NC653_022653 [Populus alba x Populus x berolinensis]
MALTMAPFFVTRFREALFPLHCIFRYARSHSTSRNDQERLLFERGNDWKGCYQRGSMRGYTKGLIRPETYKQWQMRNLRTGFRQIPLHQSIIKRVKSIKPDYHKDFIVDEDGQWVLLGWKGNISCYFSLETCSGLSNTIKL